MVRFARIHAPGALVHMISRFQEQQPFLDVDGGRDRYLDLIGRVVETVDTRVLAYALMSTHVHLVLQLGADPVGRFSRAVNSGWASWLNRRLHRIGVVFADRPQSIICDTETYALQLVRYVHNNPVRAGLVDNACLSHWTSHRAYLGLDSAPPWLAVEPVLQRFSGSAPHARQEFDAWVAEGKMTERNPEFSGVVNRSWARHVRELIGGPVEFSYPVLGPDEFILKMLKHQVDASNNLLPFRKLDLELDDARAALCEVLSLDDKVFHPRSMTRAASTARMLLAWLWCERLGGLQIEVADFLGVRPHTISTALTRARRRGLRGFERRALDESIAKLEQIVNERSAEPVPSHAGSTKEKAQSSILRRVR